ncbi:MAG TPA: Pvc16 family protein [Candidatus Dormibacteraeota bacterium]|jgi:hypothetical protein
MIDEVDEALRRLLADLPGDRTRVGFDLPVAGAERGGGAAVVVALAGIAEDPALRSSSTWDEVDEDGLIRWRRPAPRWYRLRYRITAWAEGAEQEHRLLSAVLRRLIAHDSLPAELLTGSLGELGLPLPVSVALPAAGETLADHRGRRPALDLVITAPLRADVRTPASPPARVAVLAVGRPDAEPERSTATPGDAALHRPGPKAPPAAGTTRRRRPSR